MVLYDPFQESTAILGVRAVYKHLHNSSVIAPTWSPSHKVSYTEPLPFASLHGYIIFPRLHCIG